ncbi:uncharacterized protein N7482_003058 [Penicillium canariense]|uniref:Uncharacterized protein n=1 Tax=Penicillium canariense TaxID=189055 RepID=A0A9W9IK56_9EURO|nr:uncharacterized protein N7482_003058 [Penicillium canariense]KAJ5177181.1 hypothetical protein N7482_003058 [Penicillium canariense]
MEGKQKDSLAFPIICLLFSFTFTAYLRRAWVLQQLRPYKHLIRRTVRQWQYRIRKWSRWLRHITDSRRDGNVDRTYDTHEPSDTASGHQTDLFDLGSPTYSADGSSLDGSDITSSDSDSELNVTMYIPDSSQDSTSNASSSREHSSFTQSQPISRPTWTIDSLGRTILNRAPEPLPRAQWEIKLEEHIHNGRGPGAWLDRIIDWMARRVAADFEAEVRAEFEQSGIGRRPPNPI